MENRKTSKTTDASGVLMNERKWVNHYLTTDTIERDIKINNNKSAEAARSYCRIGDSLFKQYKQNDENSSVHVMAAAAYTKAIANAPSGSEELAIAYKKRADVLMTFNKYTESVEDIARALDASCDDELLTDLQINRLTCFKVLGMSARLNIAFNVAKNSIDRSTLPADRKVHKHEILNDIMNKVKTKDFSKQEPERRTLINTNIYSDALTFEYEHSEKIVIANRDITSGEILAIENSFSSYVNYTHDGAFLTCARCMKFTMVGIPCEKCCSTVYCSENCKMDAYDSYHKSECEIMRDLNETNDNADEMFGAALRIFLVIIHEFSRRDDDISTLRDIVERKKRNDTMPRCKVHELTDKYHNLLSNLHYFNVNTNLAKLNAAKAIKCVTKLIECTDIFDGTLKELQKTNDLKKTDKFVFLCSLLTRLILVVRAFADRKIKSAKCCCYEREAADVYEQNEYSVINFFLFTSILKHNTNPNTVHIVNGQVKTIYAKWRIKKGEEITCDYECPYSVYDKHERKEKLQKLNMYCSCTSCAEYHSQLKDSPTLKDLAFPDHISEGFANQLMECHRTFDRASKVETPHEEILGTMIPTVSKEIDALVCLEATHCKEFEEYETLLKNLFMLHYGLTSEKIIDCQNNFVQEDVLIQ